MRHPPVEDHRRLNPAIDSLKAGLDLGDHAARDGTFGDELQCAGRSDFLDQPFVRIEHSGDIGQQQQPRRFDGGGDGAGDCVRVDVVGLTP